MGDLQIDDQLLRTRQQPRSVDVRPGPPVQGRCVSPFLEQEDLLFAAADASGELGVAQARVFAQQRQSAYASAH